MPKTVPTKPPKPMPTPPRLETIARQALVATLRVKAGVEVIRIDAALDRLSVLCRVLPTRLSDFVAAAGALLSAEAEKRVQWNVDISKKYLLHEGEVKTAYRYLVSWPEYVPAPDKPIDGEDYEMHYLECVESFADIIRIVPTKGVELTEVSLGPAATPNRHANVKPTPSGVSRSSGAR